MEELVEIDYITKETISFNSIIVIGEEYFFPYVVINDDPKDIAVIINDKKELDKIFREKHFKSFDDSVILDFYNEITTKLSDTKDFIRKTDVNIRKDIIDDLYKKLFAVYDIKEHNLKDKDRYTKQIKEQYINNKIMQNNSLSFSGGALFRSIKKLTSNGVSRNRDKKFTEGDKFVQTVLDELPIPASTGTDTGTDTGTGTGNMPVSQGTKPLSSALRASAFALKDAQDPLNIDLLKTLVSVLEKNSRYKEDIQALIEFNQAISNESENAKKADINKQSEDKRTTSNEFIKKALKKYKKLKKSFMRKVATDKKALDEQLQEGAEKNFIKDTTFNNIVDADEIYIENVKGLYSYLQRIDVEQKGGAPLYDIKKTENPDDKEAGATPYDFYKILKENYIEIVTLYYELIDDAGKEEAHYKFIYKFDGSEEPSKDEDTSNKINDSDVKQNTGFNKRKAALDFIKNNLTEYLPETKSVASIITNLQTAGEREDFRTNIKSNMPELPDDDAYNKLEKITDLSNLFRIILNYDIGHPEEEFDKTYLCKIYNLLNKNTGAATRWASGSDKNEKLKNAIKLVMANKKPGQELVDELTLKLNPGAKAEIDRKNASNEATALMNELKEKIRLLESRIDVLSKIETKLPGELKKICKTISKMKTIPQSTEYEDYIINILKRYKIIFFEKDKKEETDKHPIIKGIKLEKAQVEDKLKKLKSEVIEQEKERKAQIAIQTAQVQGNNARPTVFAQPSLAGGAIQEDKLKKDLKIDKESLKEKHKDYDNFVSDDDTNNTNNLHYFMRELKDNVEHLENGDGLDNSAGNNKIDSLREKGIYEDIWYDYKYAVTKPNNKNDTKYLNDLLFLTEGEKLHERVIQNDLDPDIVLKINFRDKAIYIFLIFLIRTINVITLEFLIEYNLIKSLQYAIVFYGFMYLVIIIFLIAIVNYDSYKLRIIFNYLNIHINASNILIQNVLFIIFIILVYILVKSDDFLKYFGDLLDYTNIYNNIYNYNNSLLDDDYYINLTQNEKLKLLYRIDIISMIIFIFSAFLVLIL